MRGAGWGVIVIVIVGRDRRGRGREERGRAILLAAKLARRGERREEGKERREGMDSAIFVSSVLRGQGQGL